MKVKLNSITLFVVLVALVGIFFITKWLKTDRTERNFDVMAFQVDSAQISTIKIKAVGQSSIMELIKTGNGWKVKNEQIEVPADPEAINRLIQQILQIKPKYLVTKDKSKWEECLVTDSTATALQILENGKVSLDILVGKQNFNPQARSITTFIRSMDQDEVYAIDGGIGMSINRGINDWRVTKFTQFNASSVHKIDLNGSNVLVRQDSIWFHGDQPVEDSLVTNYLTSIASLSSRSFMYGKKPENKYKLATIQLSGEQMQPVTLSRYFVKDQYVVHSTDNMAEFFNDSTIARKVFIEFPFIQEKIN